MARPKKKDTEIKEIKEVKEIRDIMKQPGKSVTYENGRRIEKQGNNTRIIYVN